MTDVTDHVGLGRTVEGLGKAINYSKLGRLFCRSLLRKLRAGIDGGAWVVMLQIKAKTLLGLLGEECMCLVSWN